MLVCVWLVSTVIRMISGCSINAPTEVTGYARGSVVLPCYCTEPPKRNFARWILNPGRSGITVFSSNAANKEATGQGYKGRVSFSGTPGNLSLSLSGLTMTDEGTYRCEADSDNYKDITLKVKDCILSESEPTNITGFKGHSVTLPCVCTEVLRKPEMVKWTVNPGYTSTVILKQFPTIVNDAYKHRVKVLDSISPGNLSLHLSDLTLSDNGTYRCDTGRGYRDITLSVRDVTTLPPAPEDSKKYILHASIAVVVAAVIVSGAVLIYCRIRTRKNASVEPREEKEIRNGEQEKEPADDSVTYSTVIHSKTSKNTIQNQKECPTEYATIIHGISS